ncbi:MAG: cobalamin-dependent protein [Deltaproteobacteria bacterium]|nr:cobalamin-dependent protein [Deltaproteobacteria bacterium]MBW2663830.1 cobalamin-dependent protein [Deltaproteobacteria bacterium]
MASIFLANAPYFLEERYGKLARVGSTLPHMGLLMLGAVLRKSGHSVRLLDASALGLTYEETIEEIKKFRPEIIALTAVTPSIAKTVKLARIVKRIYPSIPIVIGGPHFTAVPDKTLKDYPVFDYGIIGEGEHTIVDLIETLAAGRVPSAIPGVVIRKNGKIFFSPPREPVKNMDSLPFPAWDLLDGFPDSYHPALFKYKKLPATHIISSRGCPNKCIFCDTSVFSRRIRFHSPEYILELIDYLIKKFNIKEIVFEDDQFLLKKKRVEKICKGILKLKRNIAWSCSGRVNSVNDIALLKLMKHSGCWQINYGIESGNQKILDFAKKQITINQIKKAVKLTNKSGILSKGYFIFGLPYETEETMRNTIEFAKNIPLDDISIFMLTPFPGSEMYEIAKQHGKINKDFEKMNLLDVVYVPNGLSKKKLLYYQQQFMKKFYLRPRIIGNYIKRLLVNPLNVFNMTKAFSAFLNSAFGKTSDQ